MTLVRGANEVRLRAAALLGAGLLLTLSACAVPPIRRYAALPGGPPNQAINCDDPRAASLCGRATSVQPGPAGIAASASDCPEGREIRKTHLYPTQLSDCEVLAMARKDEEDSRLSDQRVEQRRRIEQQGAQFEQERAQDEDKSLGYTFVSSEDFLLDGKQLARTGGKLALQGFYVKMGATERLFPSQIAAAFATQRGTSASLGVVMLTDDAPRELRAYFLRCGSLPGSSQLGCAVRVRGHATMCERTTLVGSEALPCLAVEGGRF
jgi:hypothetical protein